jgi:membrane fusion protein, copper/silver efflux system
LRQGSPLRGEGSEKLYTNPGAGAPGFLFKGKKLQSENVSSMAFKTRSISSTITSMKKPVYILILLLLLAGSFLTGRLYNREPRSSDKIDEMRHVHEGNRAHQGSEGALSLMPPGSVKISLERQQMIGVQVQHAERKSITQTIRLLGRVAPDETRLYTINATIDGWITKTLPNTTGSYVKKNEVLAAFYSPEFLSAVQALLYALGAMDRVRTTGQENPAQKDQLTQFNVNLQQYKDSLRNLGMGDVQIDKMIKTRQWIENVDITSPADGFILVRNVSAGLRFNKGDTMYRIADLSRVWILADVFEREAKYFKPGQKAKVTLPYQDMTYDATVSEVLPVFDPTTRTLKVRLETDNPGFTLRPDMFVDVELPVSLPPAIIVPADAVLNSGLRKTVFVDRGNGVFEPRTVETGWRMGDRVEIINGLEAGERIVISGNFFIDSESRLQAAGQGIYGAMSVDPVCGMEVDELRAKATGKASVYQGKTYYFCAEECKEQFEKEPRKYLK